MIGSRLFTLTGKKQLFLPNCDVLSLGLLLFQRSRFFFFFFREADLFKFIHILNLDFVIFVSLLVCLPPFT